MRCTKHFIFLSVLTFKTNKQQQQYHNNNTYSQIYNYYTYSFYLRYKFAEAFYLWLINTENLRLA